MTQSTWFDDGMRFKLYISTAGDEMPVGTVTEYPFEPGGPNGAPLGWLVSDAAGYYPTDVARSVSDGRFNLSNVMVPLNYHVLYGIQKSFTVPDGFRAIVSIQARKMDGKSRTERYMESRFFPWYTAPDPIWLGAARDAQDGWEDIVSVNPFSSGDLILRLLSAGYADDWGVQWQGLSIRVAPETMPTITWHEVTCDTVDLTVKYGRARYTERFESGVGSIVVNNDDGDFTFRTAHAWGLRPGRMVKVEAVAPAGAGTYPFYYGIIDSLQDGYNRDGDVSTVLNCIDISSLMSTQPVPTNGNFLGWAKSGIRFDRLIDCAGMRPDLSVTDEGQWTQQEQYANGRSVRDELGLIADSEFSFFWTDRQGRLTYLDRYRVHYGGVGYEGWHNVTAEILAMPFSGVLADLPTVDSTPYVTGYGPIPIIEALDFQTSWSRDRIMNKLDLAVQGGTSYPYLDTVSLKAYGPHTYQRLDLLDVDSKSYMDDLAAEYMLGYTESILRVDSVSFKVRPGAWDVLLRMFMNNLVRVRYQNREENWGFSVVTHVQSITHAVSPDDWTMTLQLDQPVQGTFRYWDTPGTILS